ncbi:MAG: hypothetical protein L3K03_01060 [Thermoplasmata archaeon]|nr:hypothetical protein [Thermoplasmata archaeon]
MIEDPTAARVAERRRQRQVVLALVFTFLGLLALALLLPSAPSRLTLGILVGLVAVLGLWIGGILLGNAVRPYWKGRRRA